MSVYNTIVDLLYQTIDKKNEKTEVINQKAKKPLKMPKNYDFSVRNVDWNQYKNDFLLRTDAVWERSKLLDIFYVHYKSRFVYDSVSNKYMIANIRQ